jgi:hypothetical protein
LKEPVAGWGAAPADVSQVVAGSVATDLSTSTHEKVTDAVEGWGDDATAPPSELVIILLRFPGSAVPAQLTPSALVTALCSSAAATPGFISPVGGIAESESESCQTASEGVVTAVAWEQANVAAFLFAAGLSGVSVDQIAQDQSAAIPATGISESSFPFALAGGAAAVVILIVIAISLTRRTRSRTSPAPAGGWPVQAGGQAGFGYASGFEAAGGVPAAAPAPSWQASAGPAPWAASGGKTAASVPDPGAYAPAQPTHYGQAARNGQAAPYAPVPFGNAGAVPYGNASGAPTPYAPSRPSQRAAAARASSGGTQSLPERGARAFPGLPPPPPPPPRPVEAGWYPADGDPYRQRYWNGNDWAGRLRWDGKAWVEET